MQIRLIPNSGKGTAIDLPAEFALDDMELKIAIPSIILAERHGKYVFSDLVRMDAVTLTASGFIQGGDLQSVEGLLNEYKANFLGSGEMWLKRDIEAETFLRVRANRVSVNYNRGRFKGLLPEMVIEFEANVPWWYSTVVLKKIQVLESNAEEWTVKHSGTSPQCPVICISCNSDALNPISNPKLKNNTTGSELQYSGTISPGESLLIRCNPMMAYKGALDFETVLALWEMEYSSGYELGTEEATNVLSKLNPEWLAYGWGFLPGDNVISYMADVASFEGTVSFGWRPRYY